VIQLGDGTFSLLMFLKTYGDDQRMLTRKAICKDIYVWVRKTYGVPVRHADISRTRERCGLAYTKLNRPASPGYEPPVSRSDREDMIIEAFRHYGMLPDENRRHLKWLKQN